MTARDRWRRCYGFARAGKRALDCYRTGIGGHDAFALALRHEQHAYYRLPANARRQIARPV